MTSKISFAISLVSITVAAGGPDVGLYHAELLTDTGAVYNAQDNALPAGSFTGVTAGNYTLSVSRRDVSGATLAPPVTIAVVVLDDVDVAVAVPVPAPATDLVQINVPSAITFTVTPE